MWVKVLRACLDIFIVAYILYRLLLLMRGTRTGEIMAGIILLLMLYAISDYLKLTSLNWLLSGFVSNFILILVIIFQGDVRRILASLGRRTAIMPASSAESSKVIEEVISASLSMANRKIGALIVFERNTKLDEYIDVGFVLDSEINKELLVSIFLPDSPLHDGAVIIRGNRIFSVSTFLPLTKNPQIERTFGSRHRAALGITEETDAIALVISEETGKISLAREGRLIRGLDEIELRKELTEALRL